MGPYDVGFGRKGIKIILFPRNTLTLASPKEPTRINVFLGKGIKIILFPRNTLILVGSLGEARVLDGCV